MPKRFEIELILRANVAKEIVLYDQALADFRSVAAAFSDQLPESAGALRIREARAAITAARETLNQARISLNNFTIHGVTSEKFAFEEVDKILLDSNRITTNFVRRDIELARTFLEMARLEMANGEMEPGKRSLLDAQNAIKGARCYFDRTYSTEVAERELLRNRIEELESAIRDFQPIDEGSFEE